MEVFQTTNRELSHARMSGNRELGPTLLPTQATSLLGSSLWVGGRRLGFQNAGSAEAIVRGGLLSSGNQRPMMISVPITVSRGCLSKIPITSVAQQIRRVFGGAREAMESSDAGDEVSSQSLAHTGLASRSKRYRSLALAACFSARSCASHSDARPGRVRTMTMRRKKARFPEHCAQAALSAGRLAERSARRMRISSAADQATVAVSQ